jgi:hypothetical protein
MTEIYENYFPVELLEIEQEKDTCVRGTKGKINTALLAESKIIKDFDKKKKSNLCRCFKVKVFKNHISEKINETIKESISEKSILYTDKSTSYTEISDYDEIHITEKYNKVSTTETIKRVQTAIYNTS